MFGAKVHPASKRVAKMTKSWRIGGAKVQITSRRVTQKANWRHCSGAEVEISSKKVTKLHIRGLGLVRSADYQQEGHGNDGFETLFRSHPPPVGNASVKIPREALRGVKVRPLARFRVRSG